LSEEQSTPVIESPELTPDVARHEGGSMTAHTDRNNLPTEPTADTFVMPKKFEGKSAEEIAKSYMELEKMKAEGKPTAEPPETPVEAPKGEEPQIEVPKQANSMDVIQEYSDKYMEQGNSLTDQDYKDLESKLGVSKDLVDQFIRGRVADVERQQSTVDQTLGGESKRDEIFQWASENLSADDLEIINEQLRNNPAVGAERLKAKYEAAVPHSGNLIKGKQSAAQPADIFHNKQEMVMAMNHKEYNMGGAYDVAFEAKIQRSLKAGIQLY
jgi:hypothetical protein